MASEGLAADDDFVSGLSAAVPEAAAPPSSRVFTVSRKPFRQFYGISSASDQPLFYIDVSTFTRGKPDLTLHAGPTRDAPVAAVCHMPKFSVDFKVGLGDPEASADSVCWEDVTRETTVRAARYRWVTDLAGPSGDGDSRRSLMWKRTGSVGVDGEKVMALSARNHKLVDERTGELLAVFTSNLSLSKCGKLQLNVDYGESFDIMVFISCLTLYEKARRRSHSGGGGGGGGGG